MLYRNPSYPTHVARVTEFLSCKTTTYKVPSTYKTEQNACEFTYHLTSFQILQNGSFSRSHCSSGQHHSAKVPSGTRNQFSLPQVFDWKLFENPLRRWHLSQLGEWSENSRRNWWPRRGLFRSQQCHREDCDDSSDQQYSILPLLVLHYGSYRAVMRQLNPRDRRTYVSGICR